MQTPDLCVLYIMHVHLLLLVMRKAKINQSFNIFYCLELCSFSDNTGRSYQFINKKLAFAKLS